MNADNKTLLTQSLALPRPTLIIGGAGHPVTAHQVQLRGGGTD